MKSIPVIDNYKTIGYASIEDYNEQKSAVATSRLLDGSQDHGYDAEYVGYGTLNFNGKTIEIKAVYLFDKEEMHEADDGDEGNLPWETALKRFEIKD